MTLLKRPKVIENPRSKSSDMRTMSRMMQSRMPKAIIIIAPTKTGKKK